MEYKSLGDQKITNSLLQLLIEWSMIFGSRSKVREKFQLKRSKRLENQLKTFAIKRTLKMKSNETLLLLKTLETWEFFLSKTKDQWHLFIGNG